MTAALFIATSCFLFLKKKIRFVTCRPPLWSSDQSSWLQIQRSEFDSRRYQIFWEVVGLERGPLSLVTAIEELVERKSNSSGLENREYGRGDPLRWQRGTLCPQKLAVTWPTSGGRSVGIVRSRTQATESILVFVTCLLSTESRCSVTESLVIKAQCYKPEGRRFESRVGEYIF
jgi:hypothetical protein